MSQLRPCKVIISGGGIAGLTLALALEKIGVEYQLLEAYPEIAANAGGGVCLLPNALTILDQLGCYEDLAAEGHGLATVIMRDPNGDPMVSTDGWDQKMADRYGYSSRWIDRSAILRIIYGRIVHKSNLLTNKRVDSVRNTAHGVEVTTTDGSIYTGDMVIGTDGVHSRVRQEIHRHAEEKGLGEEYMEADLVPATYGSIFGKAHSIEGLDKATLDFRVNRGSSTLIGTGPPDRTFWVFYEKLDKALYGSDIPRFSNDDLVAVIDEHSNEMILPGVPLSKLYESSTEVFYSPAREFVYSKWHLDRMLIIGDSAHQMSSIAAQGGAQAVESAACFANCLTTALKDSKLGHLSAKEIDAVFERVQEIRQSRVRSMVAMSHERQLMDSMATPDYERLMMNKFHKIMSRIMIKGWDAMFGPAVYLDMFPVPATRNASWLFRKLVEDSSLRSSL